MRRDAGLVLGSVGDNRGVGAWFQVSFVSTDPDVAMRVTNKLAVLFIDEASRDRKLAIEGSAYFLEARLRDVRRQLLEKEEAVDQARRASGNRAELSVLTLETDALRDQYKALLINNQETDTAASMERREIGEQFRIRDAAQLPMAPISPDLKVMTAWGAAIGFAFGLLLLVGRLIRRSDGQMQTANAGN